MLFMQPDIYHGEYYEVSANHGETHIVPTEIEPGADFNSDLEMYVEGTIDNPREPVTRKTGWLARLSAPGYMDCTEWTAHETEQEARDSLAEYYGDDDYDYNDDE